MRVSNNQIIGSSLQAMQQQGADILKYQKQIASGNRFAKASEGAVELARGVQLQFEQSRYEMLQRNQDVIATRMGLTYSQLDTMTQVLLSLQEMAGRATYRYANLPALHAEARVALQALRNLSESTGVSGDGSGYLLPGFTNPRLTMTVPTDTESVVIGPASRFQHAGDYEIRLKSIDLSNVEAELYVDSSLVKTAMGSLDSSTPGMDLLTLDFGDVADVEGNPIGEQLSIELSGVLSGLMVGDTVTFSVRPQNLPVEPGISLPEGISYSDVIWIGTSGSKNILSDVEKFVDQGLGELSSPPANPDAITGYTELVAALNHVMSQQVRASAIAAQVEIANSSLGAKRIELDDARARLLETDIAEASTKLVRAQTLLQAAQSIFSRLESSNLFQRLG